MGEGDHGIQVRALTAKLPELVVILEHLGVRKTRLDFVEAPFGVIQAIEKTGIHTFGGVSHPRGFPSSGGVGRPVSSGRPHHFSALPYFLRKRSTRPAVSTRRCLPV